jgi:hypothetical protein
MVDLTKTYDVLVMGGGNVALCAAISARRAGAIKFGLDPAALNDTVGPIGLLVAKARRAKDFIEERQLGMNAGFTVMLLLTAVTGLLLLVTATNLRDEPVARAASRRRVRAFYHVALWQIRARHLSFRSAGPLRTGAAYARLLIALRPASTWDCGWSSRHVCFAFRRRHFHGRDH